MPIRRELRWFYPIDWQQLSRQVRFGRAKGACEHCGRRHGEVVRCLPDGRWLDTAGHLWRSGDGQPALWPEIAEVIGLRKTRVSLAAAHLDHNPGNNRLRNLQALCQRCHMLHDRPHHLARRWITYRMRRALGDLFLGAYANVSLGDIPKPDESRVRLSLLARKQITAISAPDRTSKRLPWLKRVVPGL